MKLVRRVAGVGLCVIGLAATTHVEALVIGSSDASVYQTLATYYPTVGQISGTDTSGQFAASGVVIAPNWILTAGHVVASATSLTFYLDGGGSWTSFSDGSRVGVSATDWQLYPKYDGNVGSGYDIGLIHFDVDLTGGLFDPAVLYTGSAEIGLVGTAVGYGMTGTGATGATSFDGLKRAGENVIDAVAVTPGKGNRILLSDFDSGPTGDNSYGAWDPLSLESLIAPGDSGGGLFIPCGNPNSFADDCLAGITSFVWGRLDGDPNSDFGDVAGFTRVSSFASWIESTILPPTSGGGGKGGGNGGGPKPRGASGVLAASVGVPEPATFGLFAFGLAGLSLMRRRKAA